MPAKKKAVQKSKPPKKSDHMMPEHAKDMGKKTPMKKGTK